MKRLLLALAAALPLAANPISTGVVLVPINPGTVNGAGGSQWVTRLWAHNPAGADARIESSGDLNGWPVVASHSTAVLDVPYAGVTHPGFFLYTRSANGFFAPPDLWLELRTLDSASSSHNAGTSIPLPALTDFRTGTIVFPNVPANGHAHIRLRIYATSDSAVAVRAFDGSRQLSATVVGLTGSDGPASLPRIPAYAELEVASGVVSDELRVELDASADTWAFISVTDDATHEFTIVEPHLPPQVVISKL